MSSGEFFFLLFLLLLAARRRLARRFCGGATVMHANAYSHANPA